MKPAGGSPGVATERSDATWLSLVSVVCTLVVLVIYLGPIHARMASLGYPPSNFFLRYLAVTLLGGLVGFAEVVLRYKDEPLLATLSLPGVTFLLLNSAVAVFALFLVEYLGAPTGATPHAGVTAAYAQNVVQRVLLTGIGAMVVLRGKLLTVPLPGGGTAELGFAPLVEAILSSVNRFIDRNRAHDRLGRVAPLARQMAPLGFRALAPFFRTGLQSLQTLDDTAQKSLIAQIAALEQNETISDCAKIESIGYELLNNFGDLCFRRIFEESAKSAHFVAEDRWTED